MNTYLVKMRRITSKSSLSIHIDADNNYQASRFAFRQLNDNRSNWITYDVKEIKSPKRPYDSYKGYRIWFDENCFIILQPGETKCIIHKIRNTSLCDIKDFIDIELISV